MKPQEQVVAAAVIQLTQTPFELVCKGLNTSRFEELLPGLRSKVARQFGSSEGLILEVLGRSVAPDRTELTTSLVDGIAIAMMCGDSTHEEVLQELGAAYFDAMCDDPLYTLQVYAWLAAHDNRELRRDLVALYGSLDSCLTTLLERFVQSWGRTMSDGVTIEDLAVAVTALTEGLAARAAVDPDAVPSELFGTLVARLVHGMTVEVPTPSAASPNNIATTAAPTLSHDRDAYRPIDLTFQEGSLATLGPPRHRCSRTH